MRGEGPYEGGANLVRIRSWCTVVEILINVGGIMTRLGFGIFSSSCSCLRALVPGLIIWNGEFEGFLECLDSCFLLRVSMAVHPESICNQI